MNAFIDSIITCHPSVLVRKISGHMWPMISVFVGLMSCEHQMDQLDQTEPASISQAGSLA